MFTIHYKRIFALIFNTILMFLEQPISTFSGGEWSSFYQASFIPENGIDCFNILTKNCLDSTIYCKTDRWTCFHKHHCSVCFAAVDVIVSSFWFITYLDWLLKSMFKSKSWWVHHLLLLNIIVNSTPHRSKYVITK